MTSGLDQFFNQTVPATLWHYTDLVGLEGILSSGVTWATEVRSTMDLSEFVHAREFIKSSIDDLSEQDSHDLWAKHFVLRKIESDIRNGLLSDGYQGIFVASLSAARDLMSQWGWYAQREKV